MGNVENEDEKAELTGTGTGSEGAETSGSTCPEAESIHRGSSTYDNRTAPPSWTTNSTFGSEKFSQADVEKIKNLEVELTKKNLEMVAVLDSLAGIGDQM